MSRPSFIVLLTVALLRSSPLADGLSNAGKSFVQTFNFNHPTVEDKVLHAFVLSTEAASCLVTITVDRPPLTTYTVPVNKTQAVVHTVNVTSTRGVKLEAPCDFIVYGLNFATQSADGWLALPVESLGTEYFILGVQPWLADPTQLTLVAAEDNTTCETAFPNGTRLTSNLNSIGVAYMTSTLDLTGTTVKCNQKVTVLTGQRCSLIPAGCTACDHTVEQVPPKSTLGRHFAMIPLKHACTAKPTCCSDPLFCAKCTEIFRIAAVENDTVVTRNGTETKESFTLQAGQSRYILLTQTEYSYLVSTKPVLLGHYFNGQGYQDVKNAGKATANSDPAFAIIPQVESYNYKYQTATCFPQFTSHFVNLVVRQNSSAQMLLNGAPFLTKLTPKKIPGTDLEAYQYQFACNGAKNPISFTIQHSGNASFGMFAYGFNSWISYGYPGGMTLNDDVYYKCAPSQLNVTEASVRIVVRACNVSSVEPTFVTATIWTDEQCCKGNSSLTFNDTVLNSTACLRSIERTWSLTDACGRTVQASQLFVVEKTENTYRGPAQYIEFDGQCSNVNASNVNETGGVPMLDRDCGTTSVVNFTDTSDNRTYVNRTWTVFQQCTDERLTFNQMITCEPPSTIQPATTTPAFTTDLPTTIGSSSLSPETSADPLPTTSEAPAPSTEAPTEAPTTTEAPATTEAPTEAHTTETPTETPTEAPPTTSEVYTDPPTTSKAPTEPHTEPPITTEAPADPTTPTEAPTEPPTTSEAPTEPPTTSEVATEAPTTTAAPTDPTNPPTDPPTTSEAPTDPPTTTEAPTDPPTTPEDPTDPTTISEAPTDPPTTAEAITEPPTTSEAPLESTSTAETPTDPPTEPLTTSEAPTDPPTDPPTTSEGPTDPPPTTSEAPSDPPTTTTEAPKDLPTTSEDIPTPATTETADDPSTTLESFTDPLPTEASLSTSPMPVTPADTETTTPCPETPETTPTSDNPETTPTSTSVIPDTTLTSTSVIPDTSPTSDFPETTSTMDFPDTTSSATLPETTSSVDSPETTSASDLPEPQTTTSESPTDPPTTSSDSNRSVTTTSPDAETSVPPSPTTTPVSLPISSTGAVTHVPTRPHRRPSCPCRCRRRHHRRHHHHRRRPCPDEESGSGSSDSTEEDSRDEDYSGDSNANRTRPAATREPKRRRH